MILKKHALWLATYIANDFNKHKNINKRESLTRMAYKFLQENQSGNFFIDDMMFRKHISKLVQDINKLTKTKPNVDNSVNTSPKVDTIQPDATKQLSSSNFQDDFPA